MKSFEQGFQPEDIDNLDEEEAAEIVEAQPEKAILSENSETATESHETAELTPESALAQEKGIFKRLQGKAKEVAAVMMLITALSATPGFTHETYAQESGRQPVAMEQVEEKQESSKEFSVKEGDHEVRMKFSGADWEKVLDEQNIRFDEEDGSLAFFNEKQSSEYFPS